MKCEKCGVVSDSVKPWTIKSLGVAGTFTWHFCPIHTPTVDRDRPYTKDQIESILATLETP